jgi:hypothetical protein
MDIESIENMRRSYNVLFLVWTSLN